MSMLRAEKMCHLLKATGCRLQSDVRVQNTTYVPSHSSHVTIRGKHFRVLSSPGDGRCFYHAVAKSLNHKRPTPKWTADAIIARVKNDYPDIRTTWAEDSDVSATALTLGIKIKMWEGMNRMWIVFGEDNCKQTILLYNPHNVHYEGLIPIVH